jgi:hypothetical protein
MTMKGRKDMDRTLIRRGFLFIVVLALLAGMFCALQAQAVVLGQNGPAFTLTAKEGNIRTGDGDSIPMWGFALPGNDMQYPGPTLIVNQGDTVTVTLTNQLRLPVSLVFPGQKVTVSSTGGVPGLLTTEVPPDNGVSSVTYTFTATQPGTYTYYSGSYPELEMEMGLSGALVVRPAANAAAGFTGFDPSTVAGRRAFANVSTSYDREYMMMLSEIDVEQHKAVERGELADADHADRRPVTWFENGRTMPDTMADPNTSYLPTQPYNSFPLFHPGEKVLIRFVGLGMDMHPLHTHGQNHLQIARDGMLLNSTMDNTRTPDLGVSDYTTTVVPGETVDAIYGTWTGAKLGWDVYGPKEGSAGFDRHMNWGQFVPLQAAIPGHTCNYVAAACTNSSTDPACFDPVTHEYCPDHDKLFPLQLPTQTELTFGLMWGGSPFLGVMQTLPPINTNDGLFHSQQNPGAGISFMWHSHNEREITTNNLFIGGMATMSLVLPYTDPAGKPIVIDKYKP